MPARKSRREKLGQVTTVREFTGGWNTVDNEFNMPPKYARVLRNAVRQSDGTIGPRWGTQWFASISTLGIGNILDITYFSTYIVGVTDLGNVFAVNGQGTIFEIWNDEIAATHAGASAGWSDCTFVSFAPFKNKLVVCNGIDKPLVVDSYLNCKYLVDEATGTNINTPIGRYVAGAVGEAYGYLVIAGNPLYPSLLHISNADSIGTFLGDTAPNDAVEYDLGAKVTSGSATIKGIRYYRDRLIVGFEEVMIAVQLGQYNAADEHVPIVTDLIEGTGCISHRTMLPIAEDIYHISNHNAHFITRAKLSSSLVGEDAGELIQPELQGALSSLSEGTLEDRVFAVPNHNENQWMLFIPNDDDTRYQTESLGFVYAPGRPGAWSEMRDWHWRGGCSSSQNNIFFATQSDIYRYGTESNPVYRDYVDDQESFSDGTKFTDSTGFISELDAENTGISISWAWELPWADFERRMSLKRSLFLGVDASGPGTFVTKMYIDDTYEDLDDPGEAFTDDYLFSDETGFERETPLTLPALTHDFVGGGRGGFGVDAFGQLFGGGLRSNTPKLYRWPARFKIAKMRFEGDTLERLRIAAFSLTYTPGGLRR